MRPLWIALAMGACRPSVEAPTSFSTPMVGSFVSVLAEPEVLAPLIRELEAEIYRNVEVDASGTLDRSIEPGGLTEADVAHLTPRPDRDPALNLPIAVAWPSPHEVDDHARIPLVPEQAGDLEPSSPDHFNREFLAGDDCWLDKSCVLNTFQDLTKVYGIVPPITYAFYKDFRWIDLSEDDTPRWAFVACSWDDDSYSDENDKNTLWQSYTLELWIPRDGRGFTWEAAGETPPSEKAGDSDGGGTMRFLSLWNESEFGITDDPNIIQGVVRGGIDRNMKAHDDWLDEN